MLNYQYSRSTHKRTDANDMTFSKFGIQSFQCFWNFQNEKFSKWKIQNFQSFWKSGQDWWTLFQSGLDVQKSLKIKKNLIILSTEFSLKLNAEYHYNVKLLAAHPEGAEKWVLGSLYITMYDDSGKKIEQAEVTA